MDSPKPNDGGVSLESKYIITIKRFRKIPFTFSREKPSYFMVDLFWTTFTFVASLIFAAAELRRRRGTLWFAFQGSAKDLDFQNLDPDLIVKYLSKHKDKVQEAIDSGNGNIHFLARIVDPLPSFMAQPHKVTFWAAGIVMAYFVFRFCVLHRHWRYNGTLLLSAYASYIPIYWLSPADVLMAIHLTFGWVFPAVVAISVVLHWLLGEKAWKSRTLVLELKPGNDRERGGWEDTDALLNYDEITKKGVD